MFGWTRWALAAGLSLALPASAAAQAMAEYGANVARGGVAGAAAGSRVGGSTSAVMNQASRTMNNAARSAKGNSKFPIASPTDPKPAAQAPAPAPQPEATTNPVVDPAEVKEGLERQELFDKFGKPAMRITMMDGGDVVERLLYRAPGRDTVLVILRNGKVASAQALVN